jgi:5'-nucleotidase
MTLGKSRILVSNDDGIYAPGLKVLERIAHKLSKDVWTVAPETEQSGAAHSLSLHLPVRSRKLAAKRYAVSGTPTDCVLLALKELIPAKTKKVDLVLSGVNRSSNVGDDITYSGTVAAAMEGTNLEVPSIALSLLCGDQGEARWTTAEQHAPALIKKLVKAGWPKNTLININFPDCAPDKVKGIRYCAQGKRLVNVSLSSRVDPKGRPYYWLGGERDNTADRPGVDIDLLDQDFITVTPLGMDLTDYRTLERLRKASR